ncbi:unnamed protein product [Brassicogethes aeneus]|uniref:Claspin n=1 Tax=Brassicogethes aeneus TaxID=1431903 RepID=A0A9P0FEN2_BRAAE|nr:unnamed protein product [Brassicogethes aeneus]
MEVDSTSDVSSNSNKDQEIGNNDKTEETFNETEENTSKYIIYTKGDKNRQINNPSYSEEEIEITPHNKSQSEKMSIPESTEEQIEAPIYKTNDKENKDQKNCLLALCDSESSDEEVVDDKSEERKNEEDDAIKPVIYKKSTKSNKMEDEEEKKMTGKEAAEQRKEIHSESQRMLRESNVSLPYHKPKSYTLKEFLSRRSKLASSIPIAAKTPPSVAIKMSRDMLEIVSNKMKEREKEVKEFYKSESESDEEDEDDKDYVPENENTEKTKGKNDLNEIPSHITEETPKESKTSENLNLIFTETMEVDDSKANIENEDNQGIGKKDLKYYNLLDDEETPKEPETSKETEESEKINTENTKLRISTDFDFNIDDIEDSEMHAEKTSNEKEVSKKSIKDILKEKLASITPKLSGAPEEDIDLELGVTKENEVSKLIKRFHQHTSVKHTNKHKVNVVSIVSVSGGEIHKETLAMNVDDEDTSVVEEKPGAKLQKLRDKLQNQMALKRSEVWQKKFQKNIGNESKEDEKPDYEENADDELLDDEEEEELSESESENEDLEEKTRKKSKFLDDEAEDEDEEEDNEDDKNPEENMDETTQSSNYSDVYDNINDIVPKKKTLKRILKGFTEDSDEEKDLNETLKNNEDDVLLLHQPESSKTPNKKIATPQKSEFDFLTPITFMTGLQNLNLTNKAKDSPVSAFPIQSDPSPFKNPNWHVGLQKNLFGENECQNADTSITTKPLSQDESNRECDSQNIEELANMCTGQFPDTQSQDEQLKTQDLLNVCSGGFTDPSNKTCETYNINPTQEIMSLDTDQDLIISQLLDEEELENFKKKFDSPIKKSLLDDASEVAASGGVIDSDDEDENVGVRKRKKQQIVDTDDEDEDADEEQIDLHDEDDEMEEETDRNVDYDSEENEIEITNEDDDERDHVVYKPSEFFDKEAELSESEWGSADEDEKELDKFEAELGDKEKFNQEKLKKDLEKIHMRRMLDDDTREIKLLQELLLEDGELHGSGRERQFKWKNIDSMTNDEESKDNDDDDVYLDEEESEEQWRKKRHEREMFLKEKLAKKMAEDEDLSDSQILKLGKKVLQVNKSSNQVLSLEKKSSKRGSFLSRSDQVLQRLAEYNKISNTTGGNAAAKNSRNFLFQSVSQVENTIAIEQDKKRKASEGTPNVLKKIRLSSNFSPAVKKKSLDKTNKVKKLFSQPK